MSNYSLNGDNPNYEIQVGWDPPLNTYFVHIIDTTKEEDDPTRDVMWYGTDPNHIHDLDEIFDALKLHIEDISKDDEVFTLLYRDANE